MKRTLILLSLYTTFATLCSSVLGASTTIEGRFGRVEIDTETPSLTSFTLRRADGSLEPHSLLSPKGAPWQRGMPDWGTQALTYAVDETGRRFESRHSPPKSVEKNAAGGRGRARNRRHAGAVAASLGRSPEGTQIPSEMQRVFRCEP